MAGEGAERAAALTARLVNRLHPGAVFSVGVAGGLKDDAGTGDAVVGTRVYESHGGKRTPGPGSPGSSAGTATTRA
ncbi:phosphorylase family protein [Streptomyces griseomycini]|uniref:Nucleoside phosphorylase n=1 Tax=Streptomyces griseomycini TaxID=66895 RepID=A0A7W7LVM2_9ACTN|nr:hypothetical protein [Streptomyces griseomycini]MBB4896887.1 nucleoside phosphorylase [Streptomyces griseomycini]GGQ34140.1 hypothetical protein GCM10010266_66840 [Streptomyces griseomycini]GGR29548.1 hypothetical protein GCM10015536_38740 [Streptomyces griseomycini]